MPSGISRGQGPEIVAGQNLNQRELRASEELHRVTLNNMTDTVLITDDEGKFTYVCRGRARHGQNAVVRRPRVQDSVLRGFDADRQENRWPVANRHVVAEDLDVEGVAVEDIDGDGAVEIVAGPNVSTGRPTDGTGSQSPRTACLACYHGRRRRRRLEIILVEGDAVSRRPPGQSGRVRPTRVGSDPAAGRPFEPAQPRRGGLRW